MSFATIEHLSGNASVTFSATADAGELLVASIAVVSSADLSLLTIPAGYTLVTAQQATERTIGIYYKEADGTEADFVISGDSSAIVFSRYSKAGPILSAVGVSATGTNVTTLLLGPLDTSTDSLLVATFRNITTAGSAGFSNGFTTINETPTFGSYKLFPAFKVATDASEDVTHTLNVEALRVTGSLVSFTEGVTLPTLRKGGSFETETTLTTLASATLNGNAITVNSLTDTTASLTDSDGTITTSGLYDLVLTDDLAATETISVQVNVVGLPSNKVRKDGGILASLTDLELRASNAGGTSVKQLSALTTDASGDTAITDLSDLSDAVGDPLTISMYSPSAAVGIKFVQALELI